MKAVEVCANKKEAVPLMLPQAELEVVSLPESVSKSAGAMLANAMSDKDASFSSGDIGAFMGQSVTREINNLHGSFLDHLPEGQRKELPILRAMNKRCILELMVTRSEDVLDNQQMDALRKHFDGVMAKKEFNEKIAGEVIHSLGGSLDEMISSGMIENMMIDEE